MKLSATVLLATAASVQGFTTIGQSKGFSTALNEAKIYYASSTGNTETIAGYISEAAGCDCEDIGDVDIEELKGLDSLIVGAPTWNTGADTERSGTDWDDFLYQTLPDLHDHIKGKKVAVFGLGDQESYGDNFSDAAGELYDLFETAGAKMYGLTSQEGYGHDESKAIRDGKFCGLICDEDNQYDMSEDRAQEWVDQLKSEGFF